MGRGGVAAPKVTGPSTADKRAIRDAQDRRFREAIWRRDKGICRATNVILVHGGEVDVLRGEVAHLKPRRAYPELRVSVGNGILLSAYAHWLSDHRGGRLLRMIDPETGEPAIDANAPITFVLRSRTGTVLWERTT